MQRALYYSKDLPIHHRIGRSPICERISRSYDQFPIGHECDVITLQWLAFQSTWIASSLCVTRGTTKKNILHGKENKSISECSKIDNKNRNSNLALRYINHTNNNNIETRLILNMKLVSVVLSIILLLCLI